MKNEDNNKGFVKMTDVHIPSDSEYIDWDLYNVENHYRKNKYKQDSCENELCRSYINKLVQSATEMSIKNQVRVNELKECISKLTRSKPSIWERIKSLFK